MGLRRFIAGGMVAGALLLTAAGPASAASITYTPATISYGTHSMLKVTGLTPNAAYGFQIYDPSGVPLIPGAVPFVADASGTFTSSDFDPEQIDPPGTYLFEVQSVDGKVVARTSPLLVGTNTYFVQHRLDG
ncbi:MAG: hypothetical protein ACR2JW_16925 [Thermomicrobiales bacterium]